MRMRMWIAGLLAVLAIAGSIAAPAALLGAADPPLVAHPAVTAQECADDPTAALERTLQAKEATLEVYERTMVALGIGGTLLALAWGAAKFAKRLPGVAGVIGGAVEAILPGTAGLMHKRRAEAAERRAEELDDQADALVLSVGSLLEHLDRIDPSIGRVGRKILKTVQTQDHQRHAIAARIDRAGLPPDVHLPETEALTRKRSK